MSTDQEWMPVTRRHHSIRLSLGSAALGAVLLAHGVVAGSPQPGPSPKPSPPGEMKVLDADPKATPPLTVKTGCSESDLRLAVATLSWTADPKLAAAQRVDVTVFKNGFETELFASVAATGEGKFAPVSGFSRAGREPGRAFDLVAAPKKDNRKNMAALEVRHLEPGVLYRWRLLTRTDKGWVPGAVVTTQAPVCVSDEVRRR